jgi:hypothetical protein
MDDDDDDISKSSSGDISPLKQHMLKRNSLFGDELLNFDPDELEDDDWGAVFDEDGNDSMNLTGEAPEEEASGVSSGADASNAGGRNSQRLGDAGTSSSTTEETATKPASTGTKSSGLAPDASGEGGGSKAGNGERSSYKQPASSKASPGNSSEDEDDQDKKESSSSATIAWQNPKVDKPYREKMMQDM